MISLLMLEAEFHTFISYDHLMIRSLFWDFCSSNLAASKVWQTMKKSETSKDLPRRFQNVGKYTQNTVDGRNPATVDR